MTRRLPFLVLLCLGLLACDPGDGEDAGVSPGDGGDTLTDAGDPSMDAGDTPMDAGDTPMDAGDTPTDGGDTPTDAGGCIPLDGGDAATFPDGSVFCPTGGGPLPECTDETPATDVSFTMVIMSPGGGLSTMVRARHYIDGGTLTEQRTRETMSPGGVAMDLLRVWTSAADTSQTIYTIQPPTPDPATLEPKARRSEATVTGVADLLATFPSYARELLPCLDAEDTIECLDDRGRFTDTGVTNTDGPPCREMRWGDGLATVCVPESCDARRTLYPYWVQADSGFRWEFQSLTPTSFDDVVVVIPSPCADVGGGIVLCDHPDL